jgi:hypothetical protein
VNVVVVWPKTGEARKRPTAKTKAPALVNEIVILFFVLYE